VNHNMHQAGLVFYQQQLFWYRLRRLQAAADQVTAAPIQCQALCCPAEARSGRRVLQGWPYPVSALRQGTSFTAEADGGGGISPGGVGTGPAAGAGAVVVVVVVVVVVPGAASEDAPPRTCAEPGAELVAFALKLPPTVMATKATEDRSILVSVIINKPFSADDPAIDVKFSRNGTLRESHLWIKSGCGHPRPGTANQFQEGPFKMIGPGLLAHSRGSAKIKHMAEMEDTNAITDFVHIGKDVRR
jgi:hypothetical protein